MTGKILANMIWYVLQQVVRGKSYKLLAQKIAGMKINPAVLTENGHTRISGSLSTILYSPVLGSRSIFFRLRVFFWPAPAPALVKKYALKKLKKMNNSTSCSRKNTFLRISFLFVHVRMQEQNRVQSV